MGASHHTITKSYKRMIFCPLCQPPHQIAEQKLESHCIEVHKVNPELILAMLNNPALSSSLPSLPVITSAGSMEKGYNSDSSNDQQAGQKRRGRPRRDPSAPKKKRGAIEYDPEGDSCTRILDEWKR